MGAVVTAALIAAGGKLIGGIIDNKQRKKDAYNNSPAGMRKNAEAAGFNPLIFAGPSVNSSAGYGPVLGSAISNAGASYAAAKLDGRQLDIQESRLAMDREKLDHDIARQNLTPTRSGLYGAALVEPANPSLPDDPSIPALPSVSEDARRQVPLMESDRFGQVNYVAPRGTSPAQVLEDEAGEGGDFIAGIQTLFGDIEYEGPNGNRQSTPVWNLRREFIEWGPQMLAKPYGLALRNHIESQPKIDTWDGLQNQWDFQNELPFKPSNWAIFN